MKKPLLFIFNILLKIVSFIITRAFFIVSLVLLCPVHILVMFFGGPKALGRVYLASAEGLLKIPELTRLKELIVPNRYGKR